MRQGIELVFQYIRSYLSSGFSRTYFFLVTALMAFLVCFNYYGALKTIQPAAGFRGFVFDYLLFFIPFCAAWFLQFYFVEKATYLKNKWLIVMIFLCPALFSIRTNFNLQDKLLVERFTATELKFWSRCVGWFLRASILLLLIYIVWFIKDRHTGPLYGTRMPPGSFRPYLLMLVFAIPLVILASTQVSFLNTYPRAGLIEKLNLPGKLWRYALFETCYAFDFLSIEMFFRGLLIVGFMRIAGMNCIIPAACFYCCIHFGKPMGEAISSYFGGILLSIISYHTRSIRGGLLVHIGLAFMMESTGFIAHSLSSW